METRVVLITAPAGEVAQGIARVLVEDRLAACVNRVPGVSSTYRWKGEVVEDAEDLLILKTTQDRLEALLARVREIHPYTVPEVLALEVAAGATSYLDWVMAETRPSSRNP
ncbi:MAG TPA: divalent-cation tolerance protein CutA [Myxococcota bacterium]|nr:divalent-cation tolerance protein CutA [Myxococcota bacterium]HQK50989.1 divalent-cation tolerance protein CutA [Myxococcota bacterium]